MNPMGKDTPQISLRDAIALLHALGWAMAGAARLSREVQTHIRHNPRRPRRKPARLTGTVVLYRPIGQAEHDLIAATGFRAFPPRLAHQPIFYPVLSEEYATQIARDWNTKDPASGYVGYVARFTIRADFLANYETKAVGSSEHQEYWIPAEDLAAFNAHIIGPIEVVSQFSEEGPL